MDTKDQDMKRSYRKKLTQVEKEEIASLFCAGGTLGSLATQYQCSRETIRAVLRKLNMPSLTKQEILERGQKATQEWRVLYLKKLEESTGKTLEERRKASAQRSRQRVIDVIFEALQGKSCLDCGESDLLVLQFDHRDPTQKTRDISDCSTVTAVIAELPKCDIVCANCHSRRTQHMFGSWRVTKLLSLKS